MMRTIDFWIHVAVGVVLFWAGFLVCSLLMRGGQ